MRHAHLHAHLGDPVPRLACAMWVAVAGLAGGFLAYLAFLPHLH